MSNNKGMTGITINEPEILWDYRGAVYEVNTKLRKFFWKKLNLKCDLKDGDS